MSLGTPLFLGSGVRKQLPSHTERMILFFFLLLHVFWGSSDTYDCLTHWDLTEEEGEGEGMAAGWLVFMELWEGFSFTRCRPSGRCSGLRRSPWWWGCSWGTCRPRSRGWASRRRGGGGPPEGRPRSPGRSRSGRSGNDKGERGMLNHVKKKLFNSRFNAKNWYAKKKKFQFHFTANHCLHVVLTFLPLSYSPPRVTNGSSA